jgi:hypothetical protein
MSLQRFPPTPPLLRFDAICRGGMKRGDKLEHYTYEEDGDVTKQLLRVLPDRTQPY